MNILPMDVRCQVLDMLCEGVPMRSISRLVDVSVNTVAKLLVDFGKECATWHDQNVRDIRATVLQIDEIWSFVFAKEKNRLAIKKPRELTGSIWTWTAIDQDSRLIVSYLSGRRGAAPTDAFIEDLSDRVVGQPSIITDGYLPYAEAIENNFEGMANHVMLLENRNWDWEKIGIPVATNDGTRAVLMSGTAPAGNPSTAYVERHNLTMRRSISRLARRTNAFSKNPENHAAALSLYMFYYNFVRSHRTLRSTPAMACGLIEHPMRWQDVAEFVDNRAGRVIRTSTIKLKSVPNTPVEPVAIPEICSCWWLRDQEKEPI